MEKLPLTGIRVIACSFATAGPFNTSMLSHLGAEVIKIEHHLARGPAKPSGQLSTGPRYPDGDPGESPWNRSGRINEKILGKLSLCLDLNNPKGKEIFLKLVKISDVVQDNYSTRVMGNFGLDYPVLKEVNPRIIMVRQPGFGTTGPYKDYVAGGCPTEVHGGLSFYMGYHDGESMRAGSCIVDPWTGIHMTCVVLAALWQRRRTGKGQFIDSSQNECMTMGIGDRVLGYQMKSSSWPDRLGNRHPSMAPHGCYPCKGADKWIAIAVASNEEWSALCQAMGNPPWTREEQFRNQTSRLGNQDELDRHIGEWTAQYDHLALMHTLQSQGVTAGDHPETGVRAYAAPPWKMSKTPRREFKGAPLLGEHNRYVLGELLGFSEQEIAGLQGENVISDRPLA
ncbi:MAG: CoA transferase [Dehalococcoidales bacterium]|nr:CoA transferase [Dehalococcoidales bacterium]